jgi:hypothetical protein
MTKLFLNPEVIFISSDLGVSLFVAFVDFTCDLTENIVISTHRQEVYGASSFPFMLSAQSTKTHAFQHLQHPQRWAVVTSSQSFDNYSVEGLLVTSENV